MNEQQEKIPLTSEQVRFLKRSAHHLKPCVQVGKKGQSTGLMQEIDQSLSAHELIKIQWLPVGKAELEHDLAKIVLETASTHIATIGNIAILFRQRDEGSRFDLVNCSEEK